MKILLSFIAIAALCVASTSCSTHTTCSAYETSIKKVEKNQDELHVSVEETVHERI